MAEQPAQIAPPVQPFLPPRKLPGPLAQLRQYWNGLRRGENAVPFSDDVNPSALTGLSDNLILVDVFDRPQRFRFSTAGREIAAKLGMRITGTFADDVETRCPLEFSWPRRVQRPRPPVRHSIAATRKAPNELTAPLIRGCSFQPGEGPRRHVDWRYCLDVNLSQIKRLGHRVA